MTDSPLICRDLYKEYRDTVALDHLDFEVPRGRIFGLLGPNGSGKTTAIRIALGIIEPDGGTVNLLGSQEPLDVRNRVGYLPEERGLYAKMKIADQLTFLGTLRGLSDRDARAKARQWLERVGLQDRAGAQAGEVSKGMQQKVQFAAAVLHEPELLVLDEPFSGLDPINSRMLKELVVEQRQKGRTIILSTHRMEEVEALCDEICLIYQGGKILSGSLSEIKGAYGKSAISLEYEGSFGELNGLPGVRSMEDSGRQARLRLEDEADTQALLREILGRVTVRSFRLEEPYIEDIYLEKVGASSLAALEETPA